MKTRHRLTVSGMQSRSSLIIEARRRSCWRRLVPTHRYL